MATTKTLLLATAFATILSLPAFATEATPAAPSDLMEAPADLGAQAPVAVEAAPAMAPAPDASADVATPEPTAIDAVPAEAETPVVDPATQTATPDTPAPTVDTAAPAVTEEAPAVVAEPAPAPAPKKAKPAKLSALAKKYDLIGLDTDKNKSLSKAEFTANGFANDKVFNRFDADNNGKLTNSEINAYASVIEANSKK